MVDPLRPHWNHIETRLRPSLTDQVIVKVKSCNQLLVTGQSADLKNWFACHGTDSDLSFPHWLQVCPFLDPLLFQTGFCPFALSFLTKILKVELFQIILNSFEQRQSPDIWPFSASSAPSEWSLELWWPRMFRRWGESTFALAFRNAKVYLSI